MPDDQHFRIPLPFGQGLDRETGVMAVRPRSFEDIRNFYLHQDKAIVRSGFESTVVNLDDEGDPVSHTLQGHSLRSERIGVVVSYQETTDKVWVHRTDTLGATSELIGEWVNDRSVGWNETVPRVFMCEVYGRVFIAHDLASITRRARTIYYDPYGGATPLNDLEGMFEGKGPELEIGTTDTAIASTGFIFFLEGVRYERGSIASGSTIGAQTVPIDKWALYRLSVSTAKVVTVTPAAGNTTGYDSEDLAKAALPTLPAGEADMGYATLKTGVGLVWIAATDALAGGSSGNPASETNYYPGEEEYFTHPIRFRGVVRHLDYNFGWGYGNEAEDAPEYVRVSKAGDPTTFSPEHWYVAGDRRDPVLNCKPAGSGGTDLGVLIVLKEVEAHIITGSGRDDFAIFLLDDLYGVVGSQLAATKSGLLVAWSAEGPRIWDGNGPSKDLSLNLELSGAEPNGLVAEGDSDIAFATYIPEARVLAFCFGPRMYALSTRVDGDWKWDYWPLKFTPLCGWTLYPGAQDTEAPTGWPQWTAIVASGIYVDVTVVNWHQAGDETLELWLSENEGAWYLAKSEIVSVAGSQVIRATDLTPGTDYRGAVRYRRGVLYTPGYTNADPMNWPSASRGPFNTSIAPPTWVSGVWSRTATAVEQILVTVTPAAGQEAQDIKVYRNTILVQTISGPHVGNAEWADPIPALGETDVVYTFLTVGVSVDSELSDPETVWAGPADIPEMDWVLSAGDEGYEVGIIPGDTADPTEVWDNYDNAGGTGAFALRFTMAAAVITGDSGALINLPLYPPITIEIKLRHKETAFTTDDFSKYSAVTELEIAQEP